MQVAIQNAWWVRVVVRSKDSDKVFKQVRMMVTEAIVFVQMWNHHHGDGEFYIAVEVL